ncbi:cupin domain-containing protein [Rhodococcus sp. ABRD24]|uniref:cupin domain-containing protein n=1 Tax=Rhodococcus sp. ABRD24 TaxID=2507582 RepID=UPI00103ABAE6|nr:cupin domain-containing protein [Rhodococcus sp. ABRD24]QBJ96940.1 cupin domain-containing protein [Rhodococcus sp. ABRD24]
MSTAEKPVITVEEALESHNPPIIRRPDSVEAKMGRFKNTTQMVFHPSEEDPTQPNAGIINYLPGAGFPLHMHEFAQMWYVIEGECYYGDTILRAGDLVYMQDPHFEYEMKTDNGCRILFLQYQGPTTGQGPIYDGRFNVSEVKEVTRQDLER